MKVVTTIKEMQELIAREKASGRTVGFVPTMGFLHEGHLTLLRKAREENDLVVLSIFVNPIQFAPNEDFSTYPRNFKRDQALAEGEKIDYLFYPSVEEMYPRPSSTKIIVQQRTNVLCGKSRPGHFDGVATVLLKLFNITMPTRAYFGKKDAQQIAIVQSLIADFNIPIKLVPMEIVREQDGLAKSSRNVNLLPNERKQALVLFKSLQRAKEKIEQGEHNPKLIREAICSMIEAETNAVIDYVEIYQYPELTPLDQLAGTIIIALAVKFANVRLIDNIILTI